MAIVEHDLLALGVAILEVAIPCPARRAERAVEADGDTLDFRFGGRMGVELARPVLVQEANPPRGGNEIRVAWMNALAPVMVVEPGCECAAQLLSVSTLP
jgi:hypothetical protein